MARAKKQPSVPTFSGTKTDQEKEHPVARWEFGGTPQRGGQNRWEPTDEDLRQVQLLSGFGLKLAHIAAVLGICRNTLTAAKTRDDRIAWALEKGQATAQANVANSLYEQAVSGNVTACIFFLKTRAGWREEDENKTIHVKPIVINRLDGSTLELTHERKEIEPN